MKSNHLPVAIRLQNRIRKLQHRVDVSWYRERGNPYNLCKGCNAGEPSISVFGHRKGCRVGGLEKQVTYYKGLLARV